MMRYTHRSRRPAVLLLVSLLSLLLAACGAPDGQQAQTAPQAAANQPADRGASLATATSAPSATPQPSATPAVNATPTAALADGQVAVLATEFAFAFSQTTFAANTPYTFVIENGGAIPHELVLVEPGEEHAHDDHGDGFSVSEAELGAGAIVSREQTFTEPGVFEIACKLPGHYEAGMKITITVE